MGAAIANDLPRQTYKTEAHAAAEERVARAFAAWAKASQLRIGTDDPDKQKPRVDRLLYRGGTVVAFFEVKTCSYPFGCCFPAGGYVMRRSSVETLRQLHTIVRVPVLLVVEFDRSEIYYLNVTEEYRIIKDFSPNNPRDAGDIYEGACFDWAQFNGACYTTPE